MDDSPPTSPTLADPTATATATSTLLPGHRLTSAPPGTGRNTCHPGRSGRRTDGSEARLRSGVAYLPAADNPGPGGDWADAITSPRTSATRAARDRPAPPPADADGLPARRPDASTVFVVGDVMGHDAACSDLARYARTALAAALHDDPPAVALHHLDFAWDQLALPIATPVTACVVSATPLTIPGCRDRAGSTVRGTGEPSWGPAIWWQLRWSNAGHPPPLLLTPTGTVTALTHGPNDLPIGVDVTRPRHDYTTIVPSGCVLLMFTDGLIEHRRTTTRHGSDGTAHLARLAGDLTADDRRDPDAVAARLLTARAPLLDTGDETTLLVAHLDAA